MLFLQKKNNFVIYYQYLPCFWNNSALTTIQSISNGSNQDLPYRIKWLASVTSCWFQKAIRPKICNHPETLVNFCHSLIVFRKKGFHSSTPHSTISVNNILEICCSVYNHMATLVFQDELQLSSNGKNFCFLPHFLTFAGGFGDNYWYWVKLVINALVTSLRGLDAGESVNRTRDCRRVLVARQTSRDKWRKKEIRKRKRDSEKYRSGLREK